MVQFYYKIYLYAFSVFQFEQQQYRFKIDAYWLMFSFICRFKKTAMFWKLALSLSSGEAAESNNVGLLDRAHTVMKKYKINQFCFFSWYMSEYYKCSINCIGNKFFIL